MHLEHVTIRNFRGIDKLELDFRDELGRIRPLTLLVGPNGSGKTTVLDAIACALCVQTKLCRRRPGLRLSASSIVRAGERHAEVKAIVRFSEGELETVQRLIDLAGDSRTVPPDRTVTVRWQYPDPSGEHEQGRLTFDPPGAYTSFEGRTRVARMLHAPEVTYDWFEQAGGVFTFDQDRTTVGKAIPVEIARVLSGHLADGEDGAGQAEDLHTLLLYLAVRAHGRDGSNGQARADYEALCAAYADICGPRGIVGYAPTDTGLEMRFTDGEAEYGFHELSSGERMVQSILQRMVQERIHSSVVLVDEIELHQHPLWQQKLLGALPKMRHSNQFIITTHSPFVRDIVPADDLHVLGDLRD